MVGSEYDQIAYHVWGYFIGCTSKMQNLFGGISSGKLWPLARGSKDGYGYQDSIRRSAISRQLCKKRVANKSLRQN